MSKTDQFTPQLNQKVRVKSLEQLLEISKIEKKEKVRMKSGLVFQNRMLQYAGMQGIITDIAEPGIHNRDKNDLKENSYRIGSADIYWTADLLEPEE